MIKPICILFFSLTSIFLGAQEVCNDAIDNDGDGLIDLNDDDCICMDLQPQSLIPNPSFEDRSCCPDDGAQLYCADSWIQASLATTDYMHTCGITSPWWLGYTTPLPFPDGQGAIGFRDGKPSRPDFKEYTGSRLLRPLEAGVEYRLDLFVGFHSDPSSESFTFSVFGGEENNSIPFGGGDENFGCPTNGPGFTELGTIEISGRNEWKNVIFEFTPFEDYPVLVIGPGCETNPNYLDEPYFYFDRITIAELTEFEIPFTDVVGEICEDNVELIFEDLPMSTYQWYLNGVALVGETSSSLTLTSNDDYGIYNVLITTQSGCFLSESYELEDGDIYVETTVEICEGEIIVINGQDVMNAGLYEETSFISNICDSIAQIEVIVNPNVQVERFDTICEGDVFLFKDLNASTAGDYEVIEFTEKGCELKTLVHLFVSENVDFLVLDSDLEITLGDVIKLTPIDVAANAMFYSWTDDNGAIISTQRSTDEIQPYRDQYFFFNASTLGGCGLKDSVFVRVSEDFDIYIPNVFSPETNDLNNKFSIGFNKAVKTIALYQIYDRWGNLVYRYNGDINTFIPWDGRSASGSVLEMGVYTYLIELELINSKVVRYAGDIFLMK